ncbi:MAG: hypothetical protein RQ756_01800, partial [Flavobacteriaceae bacterium]|nr:hypothetical protein [Flavobacteriaceae bacterium]
MKSPIEIYRNPKSTKAQLKEALRVALELPEEKPPKHEKYSLFKACLNHFEITFKQRTGIDYVVTPKDGKAMAELLKKINQISPQ